MAPVLRAIGILGRIVFTLAGVAALVYTITAGFGPTILWVVEYPDDVDLSSIRLDDLPIDWSIGPWTFLPNLPLLGLAIVFALLATIIRSGEKLQRETEGLI